MKNDSILLVDDEEIIRKTVNLNLKEKNYDVTLAENGDDAIKKLQKYKYDMVITDLVMKGSDGIQVLKEAKTRNPETMVMILTGRSDLSSAINALRLDADDYMLKSSPTDELLFRVTHCFEKLKLRRQVEKNTADLEAAIEQLESEMIKRRRAEEKLLESQKKLIEKNEELERLSSLDGLTEIHNRRYSFEYLERELKRTIRDKIAISFIMVDIDYFKAFNDSYGHLAGDDCLKRVAKGLKDSLNRPTDLLVRYGGEEFMAVLPGTDAEGSVTLAERMRTGIENLKIEHTSSQVSQFVTVSLGVATVFPVKNSSYTEYIASADKALYRAKQAGRNRVEAQTL